MSNLIGSLVSLLMTLIFFLVVISGGIIALIVPQYNTLKVRAEGVSEAFSNILVSMQKRADLAGKLQEIASTYAKDEQFTVLAVAKQDSIAGIVDAYRESFQAINIVNSVAQRYPEIKADRLYQTLMQELTGLETELQRKRELFNACVRFYNSPLKQLPTVLYAPHVGLREAPYWQSDDPEALGKLKEFKTDDERVRVLMASAGSKVADMTVTAGSKVADLTKQGVAVAKAKVESARAPKPTSSSGTEGAETPEEHAALDSATN